MSQYNRTQNPLFDEIGSALAEACRQPDSEILVGVLVSHLIDPTHSIADIQSSIDSLFTRVSAASAEALLDWFRDNGFAEQNSGAVTAEYSSLKCVVEHKAGIPITRGLMLIGAARTNGLTSYGLNFPGHFLVRVEHRVVDPLGCSVIEMEKFRNKFDVASPASPRAVALRMLNNLKALALQENDITGALDLVDVQARLADDRETQSALLFERGEFWSRLGAMGAAKDAFLKCAEICPHPELAEKALGQAARINTGAQTFH